MQRYTVYFIWKLLYMLRVVTSPIIRSANNCIYSIWYLSHRYCYLPLSWKSWKWFECHHPSSGAQTNVSTASGICHTVIAICRYRGRVGTGLSVLWVAYATQTISNSSTIAADSNDGVTNTNAVDTVVCAPDDGWRYHPKHVEQFPDKINCVTLHLVGYIYWNIMMYGPTNVKKVKVLP